MGFLCPFVWGGFMQMKSKDALADRMNMVWLAKICDGMNRYT
jgi:hypothetical protein